MEDITPKKQHLVFMDESLGDDRAISDYNIQEGAVLHLQKEWGMQIFLKTLDNQTILMDVVPVDTVGFLKAMIQHQEDIPPDQQVMISTVGLLEDDPRFRTTTSRSGTHSTSCACARAWPVSCGGSHADLREDLDGQDHRIGRK